jgi:hypothetical protein
MYFYPVTSMVLLILALLNKKYLAKTFIIIFFFKKKMEMCFKGKLLLIKNVKYVDEWGIYRIYSEF